MSLPIVNNISYSSLTDWNRCPHLYKLKHVDRLKDFTSSIDTIYGTMIHRAVQAILLGESTEEIELERFLRTWKKLCGIYKKFIDKDTSFGEVAGTAIISSIREVFKQKFGEYRVLHIEERLSLEAIERFSQNFKGFIDIVLELADGTIVIGDFKTCSTAYAFNKFKDKFKDYQLTLYKHFYAKKNGLDLSKIKTMFILLDKTKKPISFLEISSGPKKIKNALEWLENSLSAINRQVFLKNRSNCQMYGKPCTFYKSKYCP